MLLIYTEKITPRITYIFKHICSRILAVEIQLTSSIEEFEAWPDAKISYAKKPLDKEFFVQSHGLLAQQGFETLEITVKKWGDTVGFFAVGAGSALPFDIFAASFYLLSRYEEYLPHVKDECGRFMATESLAFKEGFLQQPVVDVWAYIFKAELSKAFPQLVFPKKELRTHHVVEAGQAYAYKQKGLFRSVIGAVDDLLNGKIRGFVDRIKVGLNLQRDPFDTFKWMINTAKKNSFKLSVFFLLGNALNFNQSMNTRRHKFKMLIKFIADYKEVGLIFSFAALKNPELLKSEKRRMEEITNRSLSNSMNDQFLVDLPTIYRNLVELEVKRDFTMVYKNTIGFRASTCTPFLFYDLDYEIRTPLTVHPIALTTAAFQQKFSADIEKTVFVLRNAVANVNGTFSLIFTNRDFSSSEENKIWRNIFSGKL